MVKGYCNTPSARLRIALVWFEIEINMKPDIEIGFSEIEAIGERLR